MNGQEAVRAPPDLARLAAESPSAWWSAYDHRCHRTCRGASSAPENRTHHRDDAARTAEAKGAEKDAWPSLQK